jgi:hypothetical protein
MTSNCTERQAHIEVFWTQLVCAQVLQVRFEHCCTAKSLRAAYTSIQQCYIRTRMEQRRTKEVLLEGGLEAPVSTTLITGEVWRQPLRLALNLGSPSTKLFKGLLMVCYHDTLSFKSAQQARNDLQ